jgi:leucyl-tRNA synthetase
LGGDGLVSLTTWPTYREELTVDDTLEMGVQVNGKIRGSIQVTLQTTEEEAVNLAKQINSVANALQNVAIAKVIYKPGKILNLIAR